MAQESATLKKQTEEENLEDILSEMEELEEEEEIPFEEEETTASKSVPAEEEKKEAPSSKKVEETSLMEETLSEVGPEPSFPKKPSALPSLKTQNTGVLSLKVQGNVQLELCYEQLGRKVTVCFKDQFLELSLENGAQFRLPMVSESPKNKAA